MPLAPPLVPAARSDRLRRWWRVQVLARRRTLAFLCAAAATAAALLALQPQGPTTRTVPVAARDLPAGTVLTPGDLTTADLPTALVPAGMPDDPSGRTLASPLRSGEPVTDVRLATPDLMEGHPGMVGVLVRLPDPAVVALLRPGDEVDLLATDPTGGRTRMVAEDARVLALPPDPPGAGGGPAATGAAVLLGVREHEVETVSAATLQGLIAVAFGR